LVIHRYYAVDGGYRDLPGTLVSDQASDDWSNSIYQNADASFIWMKTVWLVKLWIQRDTLKKERIKRHPADTREVGINPVERRAVYFTPIRRRPHAGEQQSRSARLYFRDYGIQISANDSRLGATQRVVRAQFEDYEVGFFGKGPVHTGEAAGGSVPRYSLVDDLHRIPLRPQTRFE
jgi:hypothetical protein